MATRTGADNKTSFVDRRPIGLCASFQHSPEIGARAVRFDPRGFGHLAHAEIAVNQTRPMISLRLYAGGHERRWLPGSSGKSGKYSALTRASK
jgi:hypothetical protein